MSTFVHNYRIKGYKVKMVFRVKLESYNDGETQDVTTEHF